jgi:hypothetical protein
MDYMALYPRTAHQFVLGQDISDMFTPTGMQLILNYMLFYSYCHCLFIISNVAYVEYNILRCYAR